MAYMIVTEKNAETQKKIKRAGNTTFSYDSGTEEAFYPSKPLEVDLMTQEVYWNTSTSDYVAGNSLIVPFAITTCAGQMGCDCIPNKLVPANADRMIVEDSEDGYKKKYVDVSAVGGGGISIPNYVYGLNIKCESPGRYCYVGTGVCRSDSDDCFIEVSSQLTIDSEASAGINAIDTGSVAASTQYYVFAIYNPTSDMTSAIFSLSRTSPTMPSGYTKKRFIGSVRTDADSDFLYMESYNMGATKYVQYEDLYSVLSGGTQTDWTDVDCSSYVPPDASSCEVQIEQGAASGTVFLRTNGKTRNWVYSYKYSSIARCGVDTNKYLEYRVVGSGTAYISVVGYYEDL